MLKTLGVLAICALATAPAFGQRAYVTAPRIQDNDWFEPDGGPGIATQLFRVQP